MKISAEVRKKLDYSLRQLAQELAATAPARWRAQARRFVLLWQQGEHNGFFYGSKLSEAYFRIDGHACVAYFPGFGAFSQYGKVASENDRELANRMESARQQLCKAFDLLPAFADWPFDRYEFRRQRNHLLRCIAGYLDLTSNRVPRSASKLLERVDNLDAKNNFAPLMDPNRVEFLRELIHRPQGLTKSSIYERYAKLLRTTPDALRKFAERHMNHG